MVAKKNRYNVNSFRAALAGIGAALKNELNFQIELGLGLIAIILGFWLGISSFEWLVIILIIGLVLSLELINTAFEQLADVNTPGFHPGIKLAKDVSAGAVLLASLAALIIGCVVFWPHFAAVFGILI